MQLRPHHWEVKILLRAVHLFVCLVFTGSGRNVHFTKDFRFWNVDCVAGNKIFGYIRLGLKCIFWKAGHWKRRNSWPWSKYETSDCTYSLITTEEWSILSSSNLMKLSMCDRKPILECVMLQQSSHVNVYDMTAFSQVNAFLNSRMCTDNVIIV